MGSIKQLASQTLTYGVPNIVGRFINVLLVPMYTAFLTSPADYGIVTIIFTFAAFLNVFFTHGMETAFFNFSRQQTYPIKIVFSAAFFSVLFASTIFACVGFYFSDYLAELNQYHDKRILFQLLFGILFFDALSAIPYAWLRQQEKPKTYVKIRLFNIAINVGLNFLFIPGLYWAYHQGVISFNPEPYFISFIFWSNLIASVLTLGLLSPFIKQNWQLFPQKLSRSMLAYGLPLIVVGFAGIINETLDRVLLKYLLPASLADQEVGIYSAFYKISLVITLFIQSFRYAAEPFFFNQSTEKNPQKTYAQVMDYFVWVCGFMVLLTLVFAPVFAKLLIRNASYFEDERGMKIVPLLLLANLFLGVYYNLSIWYKLSNKTMMGGVIASIGAVLTVVFNLLLIPSLGFVGAAWATLAAYAGMTIISFIVGAFYYPVPYSFGKLFINFLFLFGVICWQYAFSPSYLWLILATLGYFVFFIYSEKPQNHPVVKAILLKITGPK